MPYALTERQREYQRLWARNKRDKRLERINPTGRTRVAVENIDGTIKLNSYSVTWEELTQENVSKISSYAECIKKAKSYIIGRKINRMAIAALALRACEIKHGGNKEKDPENGKVFLTKFASKIGINYKTLHRWVLIKKEILDNLPANETTFDYSAADASLKKHGSDPRSPLERYKERIKQDPFIFKGELVSRYLQNAASVLTTLGYKKFSPESVKSIQVSLSAINRVMRD